MGGGVTKLSSGIVPAVLGATVGMTIKSHAETLLDCHPLSIVRGRVNSRLRQVSQKVSETKVAQGES